MSTSRLVAGANIFQYLLRQLSSQVIDEIADKNGGWVTTQFILDWAKQNGSGISIPPILDTERYHAEIADDVVDVDEYVLDEYHAQLDTDERPSYYGLVVFIRMRRAARKLKSSASIKKVSKPNRESRRLWANILSIVYDPEYNGDPLTVRQIYYQCVTRHFVAENTQDTYNKVQRAVLQMRRNGVLNYRMVRDNARERRAVRQYGNASEAIEETARVYRRNFMQTQPYHIEVWCEKDALSGVISPICMQYGVTFAAIRGFSSDSFQFDSAEEIAEIGKPAIVIYLGDHDPSGWWIAKDLEAHVRSFGVDVSVDHRGVHPEQIDQYHLPDSFEAKESDKKRAAFVAHFGNPRCVELDALPPNVLRSLVEEAIEEYIDVEAYNREFKIGEWEKQQLTAMVARGLRWEGMPS
jgi:hypothetical protein